MISWSIFVTSIKKHKSRDFVTTMHTFYTIRILKMLRRKKKDNLIVDKQPVENSMDVDNSVGDISSDEPGKEQDEVKTIQEFIDLKMRQNKVLRKLIENMDKSNDQVIK